LILCTNVGNGGKSHFAPLGACPSVHCGEVILEEKRASQRSCKPGKSLGWSLQPTV